MPKQEENKLQSSTFTPLIARIEFLVEQLRTRDEVMIRLLEKVL